MRGVVDKLITGYASTREAVTIAAVRGAFVTVTIVIGLVFVVLFPLDGSNGQPAVPWVLLFIAFAVLSSFPTWLYVRFLGVKLGAVYVEYVLNLYRLGVDLPRNLPEPPALSEYHQAWTEGRAAEPVPSGPEVDELDRSVYDRKFEAYFGRKPLGEDGDREGAGEGSVLPVFLAWVVFAAGWLAILSGEHFLALTIPATGADLAAILGFGFLGAYIFTLQLTVRAFFQNDLRSGTYVSAVERVIVVLITLAVIHVLWSVLPASEASGSVECAFAFVVGSFPIVGQQWINQIVAKKLHTKLQSMYARHPLDEIDGMNVWYQARLLEEGIEDVQNLATANLVDVVLHSRAPVGRLVDWVDQALLLQHLPPWSSSERAGESSAGWMRPQRQRAPGDGDAGMREGLHRLGVRTATDLLELYSPLTERTLAELGEPVHALWPAGQSERSFHTRMLEVLGDEQRARVLGYRMLAVLRCLAQEPNLRLVLNWQEGMKDYRKATRQDLRPGPAR